MFGCMRKSGDAAHASVILDLLSYAEPLDTSTRALLVTRQKEYKTAALKAKQQGDLEKAKEYMKIGKVHHSNTRHPG